ncbi:Alpha/Beta hydrolase protein [Mycena galericulata]|nr:Alpha/Beta hydrolase protein [Mycena galericulata]
MSSNTKLTPKLRQDVSFLRAIRLRIMAFNIYWICRLFFPYAKSRIPGWSATAPTLIKRYPVRPNLVNRIHIPPTHRDGQKHPVFVLIHGGGWVLGDPAMDDEQAHLLAVKGYVVASLDYSLGPRSRYPVAITELAALTEAVLDDASLPIDPARLVVGGFSAGGVMTLALAQLPQLRDRIRALVSMQPVTDWTGEHRGPHRRTPWGSEDGLKRTQAMFDWAYVPAGADMRDPLLSPLYATRAQIPQPLFMVASSADGLCDEEALMCRRLAGLAEGDERGKDSEKSWAANGVVYECVPDMPHGFTHFWVRVKDEFWAKRKKELSAEVFEKVTVWLEEVIGKVEH